MYGSHRGNGDAGESPPMAESIGASEPAVEV